MKMKKLISLFAAVATLSSVMAITPVAQAAGASLKITSEANSTYDRTGYKAYTVTYAISGDDFNTTYTTDYSVDDEIWTISLAGSGLMSFGVKFVSVENVSSSSTVLDRTFNLTTGTTKAKTMGWVQADTIISNFDANTFKNGIIAYAGSPIALHSVEFDETEGGEGWTSGGTITEKGDATVVKTVWYIAENSGYTIDYVYDEIAFDYGTNDNFTTYYAGKDFDVYINGTKVNADTAKLTLGETASVEPESVAITANQANPVAVGSTVTLTAAVAPAEADQAVTWTSDNTAVAEVVDGVVTAKKPGKATITATATNDVAATYEVKVLPKTAVGEGKHWTEDDVKTIIWGNATIEGVGYGTDYNVTFKAGSDEKKLGLDVSGVESIADITFPILLKLTEKADIAGTHNTAVGSEITAEIGCTWAE